MALNEGRQSPSFSPATTVLIIGGLSKLQQLSSQSLCTYGHMKDVWLHPPSSSIPSEIAAYGRGAVRGNSFNGIFPALLVTATYRLLR